MKNLKYCFEGHTLIVEEDGDRNEAPTKFYTLVKPNGERESVDFTSWQTMTQEAFEAIVLLNNPQRPPMKNRCSVPWDNESIIKELKGE